MVHIRTYLTLLFFVAAANNVMAAELPPDAIVRQGTAVLTVEDIDAFAARMPPEQRAGYFDNAKRLDSTLRQLLVDRQVANDARAKGMDKDPAIQRQILIATENALFTARIAKVREAAKKSVPDLSDLAKERYQASRDSFNVHEVLDVKHVLISNTKQPDAQARALADTVHAEAVADPDKFDALVKKYSDDPSAAINDGLMRDAGNDSSYVAEFAKAAADLTKPGQISPVVKTKFGYHILKLLQKAPARVRTFDEIKESLITDLQDDYVQQQVLDYVQGMQNQEVESNAELVNALRSRYGRALPMDEAVPTETPGKPASTVAGGAK